MSRSAFNYNSSLTEYGAPTPSGTSNSFLLAGEVNQSHLATATSSTIQPSRTGRPVTKYMALGDSFSAGNSAGKPISPNQPACDRTDGSYVYQIYLDDEIVPKNSPYPCNGTEFEFNACSGATTSDIQTLQMQNATAPYNPFITGADLYTLTAGSNDMGFDEIVKACVYGITIPFWERCNHLVDAIDNNLAVNSTFQTDLASLYENLQAQSQGRKVVILPYITFYNDTVGRGFGCWISLATRQRLNQQVKHVNAALRTAATQRGFQFLHEDSLQAAFDGHRFCDSGTYWIQDSIFDSLSPGAQERWDKNGTLSEEDQHAINNGTIGFNPGLFHPTREGHTAYYRLLKELLNDNAVKW